VLCGVVLWFCLVKTRQDKIIPHMTRKYRMYLLCVMSFDVLLLCCIVHCASYLVLYIVLRIFSCLALRCLVLLCLFVSYLVSSSVVRVGTELRAPTSMGSWSWSWSWPLSWSWSWSWPRSLALWFLGLLSSWALLGLLVSRSLLGILVLVSWSWSRFRLLVSWFWSWFLGLGFDFGLAWSCSVMVRVRSGLSWRPVSI
jgi:hypothetical protein